jgi:hypothetical protein
VAVTMDSRAREVIRIGDAAFAKKATVDSLWQEIALNFYPERADFTTKRNEGDEFSDHLFSSYPSLARRELGNMLSEFLRPEKFFAIHVDDEEIDESDEARRFLEMLTEIQWRAMMDPVAQFITATGQTDHDFAAFGNGVLWFGKNVAGDALLFRNYHLRDNVWSENAEGKIDCNHRKWCPTARQLKHYFPKTISRSVQKACEKDPDKTFPCRHIVLPSRLYDYKSKGGKAFPFVSLYVECETETVLEETGLTYFPYVIPRWQTVSGSVFASSMATAILLPDGRTLQVMMRTLREAGENYVNPPLIAVTDAIRGDIALYPGGVTTADIEYDERLGEVLRPITKDRGGFPIGIDLAAALKEDIRQGFFLDKIQLPEVTRAMTATEVRRRIQEHIRAAAPISKPIQQTYNNPLCEGVFELLLSEGVFPLDVMPESLADKDIKFKFRSPLDELAEQNEAEIYLDNRDRILAPAMQFDPSLAEIVDLHVATRDALRASGWKAKWFKPKEAVDEKRAQMAEEAQAQQVMQEIAAGAATAEQAGKGLEALVSAGRASVQPQAKPTTRQMMGR